MGNGVAAQESSILGSAFGEVVDGALGDVGSSLAGWALGAIGISTGDGATEKEIEDTLNTIENELEDIESTLTGISDELKELDQDLVQMDCDTLAADLDGQLGLITSLYQNYESFISTAKSGTVPLVNCTDALNTPNSCLKAWVNAVLDDNSEGQGVQWALNTIATAFNPQGNANGVIAECMKTVEPPKPGDMELHDANAYWNQTLGLVNYYYAYMVKGLTIYSEASHFQAWMAHGYPGGSPIPSNADATYETYCTGAGYTICQNVVELQSFIYDSMLKAYETTGAPYTDNDVVLNYKTSNNANLYPSSLENFTMAANSGAWPDQCSRPLDSSDPCGITADGIVSWNNDANSNGGVDSGKFESVKYASYTGWAVGFKDDLNALLTNIGPTETPAKFLESSGFYDMGNKIIQSRSYEVFGMPNSYVPNGHDSPGVALLGNVMIVFVDTNVADNSKLTYSVFDTQSAANDYLMIPGGNTMTCHAGFGNVNSGNYVTGSDFVTKDPYNGWYRSSADMIACLNAQCCNNGGSSCCPQNLGYDSNTGAVVRPVANWALDTVKSPYWPQPMPDTKKQFSLPMIDVSSLACTNSRSHQNLQGAFVRCGDDFDSWLTANIPKPSGNTYDPNATSKIQVRHLRHRLRGSRYL